MQVTEKFFKEVERVAKSTSRKWGDMDWEELRQDIWVYLMENPRERQKILNDPSPDRKLKRIASQRAVGLMWSFEISKGQFTYPRDHVKGLLKDGILLNAEAGTQLDSEVLALGMLELKTMNEGYFDIIVDKYINDVSPEDTKKLTRALDKLAELMSRIFKTPRYLCHDGPGSRTAISNATAQWITESQDNGLSPYKTGGAKLDF